MKAGTKTGILISDFDHTSRVNHFQGMRELVRSKLFVSDNNPAIYFDFAKIPLMLCKIRNTSVLVKYL